MSDPIYDLIYDIEHHGIRWITALTLYAVYRKEKRNYRLDRRDDALFQNLKIIMEERGRGECFVENPNSKKNLEQALLERGLTMLSPAHFIMLFTHRKVTKKSISRRKRIMVFLKSSISKKLLSILVGIAVASLNKKFDLQLSDSDLYMIFAGIIAYIVGQSHVDGKKALANTVTAISQAVQASVPNIEPMPTTFQDIFPMVKEVHAGINKIYADVQKNDNAQAFLESAKVYNQLHAIFQSIKPPEPVPEIVEAQVAV